MSDANPFKSRSERETFGVKTPLGEVPKALVTPTPEGSAPAPTAEPDQSSDRCGLFSTKALLQGVTFELENGDEIGVLYGQLCSEIEFIPTLGVRFQYVGRGEVVNEVLITGNDSPESVEQLRQIGRHLTQGKRETLRAKPPLVTAILIKPAPPKKAGEEGEAEPG